MTFPQPSSVGPVIGAKQFFRLKTPLASAGDLYESDVSALAFVLGPDSDIATVQLSYFDPDVTTSVSTAIISPDRDLVGRVDARQDVAYPGSGNRLGRILINSLDIWDPTIRPEAFDSAGAGADTIEFIRPTLDVIQYFVNPPSVTSQRSDKISRFEYFVGAPDAVNGVTWVAIPAYGRKSGYFTFFNKHPINTVRARVFGWKLMTSGTLRSFTLQLHTDDLLFNDSSVYQYKSSTDGLWDIFLVALGGGVAGLAYDPAFSFPTTVTLSDDAL